MPFSSRKTRGWTRLAAWPLAALAGMLSTAVGGQTADHGAASRNAPTLADAIRFAPAPSRAVMVVWPEAVSLPAGARRPPKGATIEHAAAAFRFELLPVRGISALAPRFRVDVAHAGGSVDPYRNAPPDAAFTLLAAGLDDAQRRALFSQQGLGRDDLSAPVARGLFETLFSADTLTIRRRATPGRPPEPEREIGGISLQQARLRVGACVRMAYHTSGSDAMELAPILGTEAGPRIYETADQRHLVSAQTVDGFAVRRVQPNTAKPGQLDFQAAALRAEVPTQGVKTVGELIARVAAATKLEIYADRRFERRSLVLLGAPRSLRAGDLLEALALCVSGAYRRVVGAVVLTDAVEGLGARRRKIEELEADGDAIRAGPLREARPKLHAAGGMSTAPLGFFGDPLAPTPAQRENEDRASAPTGTISVIHLPFEQLTVPQQQALKRISEALEREHAAHPDAGYPPTVDFERDVDLQIAPSIQLILPDVDGPIDTGLGELVADLFRPLAATPADNRKSAAGGSPSAAVDRPSDPLRRADGGAAAHSQDTPVVAPRSQVQPAAEPAGAQRSSADAGAGSLADRTRGIPRRALLATVTGQDALEATVAAMRRLGLNELWLPVFTGGKAAIRTGAAEATSEPDLLDRALKLTAGTGIVVYPALDLFRWGPEPPRDAEDLTITGGSSVQSAERRLRRALLAGAPADRPSGSALRDVVVSPLAPEPPRELASVAAAAARRAGIGGIVFREACPPGYDVPETVRHVEPEDRFGYTEAARVAFLRLHHADPIDVTQRRTVRVAYDRADTALPGFDDEEIDLALDREWNGFCREANVAALTALWETIARAKPAARGGAARPFVYMRDRRDDGDSGWYGAWSGPGAALPTYRMSFEDGLLTPDSLPVAPADAQARAESPVNLLRVPIGASLDEATILRRSSDVLATLASRRNWEGFVLEMTPTN
ncbi:MAG TPA: hypothetical protein VKT77_06665 [Chthonomonadaceae bacterium]|nr:hypothetical protein [Chthonomonadaceae bacterium]